MNSIRSQFPLFNNFDGVYLDNAATTQKPWSVIGRINRFYTQENASVEGYYNLSSKTTGEYEKARKTVQKFINAKNYEEIVFTRGATESINLAANVLSSQLKKGDEIIITEMEHHSNLVPWQMLCKKVGAKLKYIPVTSEGELDLEEYKKLLCDRTKIVAVTHVSNSLGTVNPVKEIVSEAKKHGAITLVDGAQAVPHIKVDVQDIGCDFYAFSGHKMYAPMGVGTLYIKKDLMDRLPPYHTGGKMVRNVETTKTTFCGQYKKFEAGTPNVSGAVGLAAAVEFMEKNRKKLENEDVVLNYALDRLQAMPDIKIIGNPKKRSAVVSFLIDGIHPSDIGMFLAKKDVCIRVGHHCTQPVLRKLGVEGTCRVSLAIYNTKEDIDKLVEALEECIKFFK